MYKALHDAVVDNNIPAVQEVLSQLTSEEERDNALNATGSMPTHLITALMAGHVDMVRLLVDNGADVHQLSDDMYPIFAAAAFCNGALPLLIEAGADVNSKSGRRNKHIPLLHAATVPRRTPVVKLLLEAGADVDITEDGNVTPLCAAAMHAFNCANIEALLAGGANVEGHLDYKRTPLEVAVSNYCADAALALIRAGASVKPPSGESLLVQSVAADKMADVVTALVDGGADPDAPDRYGHYPLIHAADNTSTACVNALLAAGARVNIRGVKGKTALHAAAAGDAPDIVRLLIAHGAEVEALDDNGASPLVRAVPAQCTESIAALLEAGADVNNYTTENGFVSSALTSAVLSEDAATVTQLLRAGADPDTMCEENGGPLLLYVPRCVKPVSRALLIGGADPGLTCAAYFAGTHLPESFDTLRIVTDAIESFGEDRAELIAEFVLEVGL